MKKLLLLLTLTTVTTQIMPEWRRHQGFLGGVLNTGEAIVESPAYIDPNHRPDYSNDYDNGNYDGDNYYTTDRDYGRNRNYQQHTRPSNNSRRAGKVQSTQSTNKSVKKTTTKRQR